LSQNWSKILELSKCQIFGKLTDKSGLYFAEELKLLNIVDLIEGTIELKLNWQPEKYESASILFLLYLKEWKMNRIWSSL
jgi:hypothetical protein